MTLRQIVPVGFTPLIDEPVAGSGNNDLVGELMPPHSQVTPARKRSKRRPAGSSKDAVQQAQRECPIDRHARTANIGLVLLSYTTRR